MSSVAREWREVPGRYNLKGTKCANCGTIYFPRRDFCPKCRRAGIGKIEDYDISRTGEVYSFSIVYDAPAMCDMIKPYAVVMVKTDDGVMITGQLVDVDLEKVAIGMRVRAVMRKLATRASSATGSSSSPRSDQTQHPGAVPRETNFCFLLRMCRGVVERIKTLPVSIYLSSAD